MKVNTDGVLLGAWVDLRFDNLKALDIGTGTGLISLMLAQRAKESFITAIEIDKYSADEASYNFSKSAWGESLSVVNSSLQFYHTQQREKPPGQKDMFNLIISNPPFFQKSLKSPSSRRSASRHSDEVLPFETIVDVAVDHLFPLGVLAIILPIEEALVFINLAKEKGLKLKRRCYVKTLASKPPKRCMMEFMKSTNTQDILEEVLVIQETGGADYTIEYKNLTNEFYLAF